MTDDPQQAQYAAAMEHNRQLRAELRTLHREHHRLRDRLRTLTAETAAVSEDSRRLLELSQAVLRVKKAP